MTAERRVGPIAVRLAAAFVTVAIAAVVVLATLIVLVADRQTSELLDRQHRDAATSVAVAAASAYDAAGGWETADLTAAAAVAAGAQASLVVVDAGGQLLAAATDELAEMIADMHGVAALDAPRGQPVSAPVELGGARVGTVALRFPAAHDTPADHLRTALWRAAVAGSAVAAAVALAVGVLVAARLTRPVVVLTAAARRLAAGDRRARADVDAPGELGELAATFDEMAERLAAEDELRRRLVSDVAHELRTPLTILRGETEALLDGITTPDRAGLGSLHSEVGRLSGLVADLETLAAADAATLTLRPEPVDLAEIAARAIATVRGAAADAGLRIEEHLEPAATVGDPARLHQVALNLLANAVKFTPAGGTITVSTGTGVGGTVLEVSDTGPGLPGDEAGHVFDRFWRGSAGSTAGGSGIGLAVAAQLASVHGGTLLATDDAPGARFTLTLPASANARAVVEAAGRKPTR